MRAFFDMIPCEPGQPHDFTRPIKTILSRHPSPSPTLTSFKAL